MCVEPAAASNGSARASVLARWIDAFAPPNARQRSVRDDMRQLLLGSPQPFARDQYRPGHFTASALVLAPDHSRLLLIYHRKLQRWLQPGGHVEPSDRDPEATARRELAEETGLTEVRLLWPGMCHLDRHRIPAYQTQPAHDHFDLRFAFVAASNALPGGSDPHVARWVRLDELAATGTDDSVVDAARGLPRASSA